MARSRPVFGAQSKEEFLAAFERRVRETITQYTLMRKKDRVVVAASGGKDSMVTLFLLKKLGYKVSALAIDEGINGYRNPSLLHLRHWCRLWKIPLQLVSFKEVFGKELDTILKRNDLSPCTVCGTFRRHLMSVHAKGFDVIATGHNADDEAQAILMNLCKANLDLFPRLGPVTGAGATGFTKRVKPLYFCTEKEILTYALLQGFAGAWDECPYAHTSFRADVRDELNRYEHRHPGAKRRILARYLGVKRTLTITTVKTETCPSCGEPSAAGQCKACRLHDVIRKK
jgi:uncharacterized protein (TIGR00269 family)